MMLVTHYRRRSCHGENFVLFDLENGYIVIINSGGGILINLPASGSLPGLLTGTQIRNGKSCTLPGSLRSRRYYLKRYCSCDSQSKHKEIPDSQLAYECLKIEPVFPFRVFILKQAIETIS